MSSYQGTTRNDQINGNTLVGSPDIDAGAGDDYVLLGPKQIYQSGPGNDTIVGSGTSDYAFWYASEPGKIDLERGIAFDGFGGSDVVSGIDTVHGSKFGITVQGTNKDERVFVFGGKNILDLGGGRDTALYWDLPRDQYEVRVFTDHFEIINVKANSADILTNIEILQFWKSGIITETINLVDLQNLSRSSGFSISSGTLLNNYDAHGNPRFVIAKLNFDDALDIALRFDPDSSFVLGKVGRSPIRFYLGNVIGGFDAGATSLSDNLAPTLVNRIVRTDFNSDGLDDIVIAASGQDPYDSSGKAIGPWPGEQTYVLLSGPSGYRSTPVSGVPAVFAHHASVGEITGDDIEDVFISSIWNGPDFASYFLIADKRGNISLDRSRLPESIRNANKIFVSSENGSQIYDGFQFTSTCIFDANNDGFKDLALLPALGTPRGIIFLNDGKGYFSDDRRILLPAGPFGGGYQVTINNSYLINSGSIYLDTEALDINNDGRTDLISIVTKGNVSESAYEFYKGAAVQILINTREGFIDQSSNYVNFIHQPSENFSHYDTIDKADVNADGFIDLLLYRGFNSPDSANATRILLNDGKGHFNEAAYPVGIPKGLLLPVNYLTGQYAVIVDAGSIVVSKDNLIRVDGAIFDWSKGLDFFTGEQRPTGNLSSDLPGRWLHGTNSSQTLTLSSGDERAYGYGGSDTLVGLSGNDTLDGGDGVDTAVYTGKKEDYQITQKQGLLTSILDTRNASGAVSRTENDGVDSLISIERLRFSDTTLAFDIDGLTGKAYRVYKAAFNRDPMEGDKAGLGYWVGQIDKGMDLIEVSARFVDSKEFRDLYGTNPTNAQFLTKLYQNVLGRAPEATGYNWWLNELNTNPSKTKAKVLADFSESSENQTGVAALIGNGIAYEPWVG